jgi:hypothetical protein
MTTGSEGWLKNKCFMCLHWSSSHGADPGCKLCNCEGFEDYKCEDNPFEIREGDDSWVVVERASERVERANCRTFNAAEFYIIMRTEGRRKKLEREWVPFE